jgi:hypothetical protein
MSGDDNGFMAALERESKVNEVCEEALRIIEAQQAEIKRLRAEVERLMDGMELAWGLIANGQYWDRTDGRKYGEWNEARLKWRDEHWHPALNRNKEARRER